VAAHDSHGTCPPAVQDRAHVQALRCTATPQPWHHAACPPAVQDGGHAQSLRCTDTPHAQPPPGPQPWHHTACSPSVQDGAHAHHHMHSHHTAMAPHHLSTSVKVKIQVTIRQKSCESPV
jgi:hypothetical protein